MCKSGLDDVWLQERARAALGACYGEVVAGTLLTPLEALEAMAAALGDIYRQAAEQHRAQKCVCGWVPNGMHDVLAMQGELLRHCGHEGDDALFDLVLSAPMGHG